MDLRQKFWDEMEKLAGQDKGVIVLTGDLGYSFMETYAEKYPRQFINAGIAEQNMIGVAAGLARAGKKPYVYTGEAFYYRCLEQVRDDIALPKLNVKLIATGASGFLGYTHNLAPQESMSRIVGSFGIATFSPQSETELKVNMQAEYKHELPAYIRL